MLSVTNSQTEQSKDGSEEGERRKEKLRSNTEGADCPRCSGRCSTHGVYIRIRIRARLELSRTIRPVSPLGIGRECTEARTERLASD